MRIETRDTAKKKMLSVSCDDSGIGRTYQSEMVINNDIPYLLRCARGQLNGRETLLYDLSGYTSLDDYLKGKNADSAFYRKLMLSLSGAFDAIEEFLISREHMVISGRTVFVDDETLELKFLCFPYERLDTERALNDLSEFLLSKLDNSDKNAVTMGHRFFRLCMKKEVTADALRKAVVTTGDSHEESISSGSIADMDGNDSPVLPEKRRASKVLKKAVYSLIGAETKEDSVF